MTIKSSFGLLAFILSVSLMVLLPIVGWIINIVKFANTDFKEPYKAEIIRGVGIGIAPIGMVTGYIKIKD